MTKITQMACTACGYAYSKARSTSRGRDGSVCRQRVCEKCKRNFTTYEITSADHAMLLALRNWSQSAHILTNQVVREGTA